MVATGVVLTLSLVANIYARHRQTQTAFLGERAIASGACEHLCMTPPNSDLQPRGIGSVLSLHGFQNPPRPALRARCSSLTKDIHPIMGSNIPIAIIRAISQGKGIKVRLPTINPRMTSAP